MKNKLFEILVMLVICMIFKIVKIKFNLKDSDDGIGADFSYDDGFDSDSSDGSDGSDGGD